MDPKRVKKIFNLYQTPIISLSLQEIPLKAQEMSEGISVSGVQPKLSLKLDRQRAELVVAPKDGEYILKPQIPHFPHVPENENCCMDIAGALGIKVPSHCLLPLQDGSLAYVVKCFNLQNGEGILQEDFCQLLGKKDKYLGSLEEIGKKLGEISTGPGQDIQHFFECVILHFLVGHGDSHFKNYSIFHPSEGTVRLSPAFDIVSSKLFVRREEDSALTLNGKKNHLTRGDFDAFAEFLKIPEKTRYEKLAGKSDLIKPLIFASQLPENSKKRFVEIILTQYDRLKLAR